MFFCFTALMQFQRDLFCEALDPTACGVEGGLQLLMLVLKRKVGATTPCERLVKFSFERRGRCFVCRCRRLTCGRIYVALA